MISSVFLYLLILHICGVEAHSRCDLHFGMGGGEYQDLITCVYMLTCARPVLLSSPSSVLFLLSESTCLKHPI